LSDPRVQRLIEWVAQRQASGDTVVGPDTDLVATGLLDSMGIVSLFFLVETLGGQPVDLTEAMASGPLTPERIVDRYLP
jgi:hypothetical protein